MSTSQTLAIVLLTLCVALAERVTLDDYINTCMDGVNHKSKPDKEDELFQQCTPWKNRSCCTMEVTQDMHISPTWYNMDWSHCPTPLSSPCQKHFMQDLCFYECSPNVGPWLVPHNISIRNERFVGVPLCKTECDAWFNACKNDFTCMNDWSKGWDWSSGTNECPAGSTCQTFQEVFMTAENMCQTVWGGSFKVVSDNEPCMLLWFDGQNNPNDEVSLKAAEDLLTTGSASGIHSVWTTITACTTLCLVILRGLR